MESLEHITLLLLKQFNEPLPPAERQALDNWLNEHPDNIKLLNRLNAEQLKDDFEILRQYNPTKGLLLLKAAVLTTILPVAAQKRLPWLQTAVAAAVIIIAGMGVYWIVTKTNSHPIVQTKEIEYKTLTVPSGKQSFIQLPDSTQVWLNAGSSLRYPEHFSDTQRTVELTGEAFFDVTKRIAGTAAQHFSVKLKDMEINVTGTRFDVKSYEDDAAPNTTLLEGNIEVRRGGHVLKVQPGERATLNLTTGDFMIKQADTNAIISWMTDDYYFGQTPLPALLKDLERWYGINIEYNPNDLTGEDIISGTFPKTATLSTIAKRLGRVYQQLDFSIREEKLVIRKKK